MPIRISKVYLNLFLFYFLEIKLIFLALIKKFASHVTSRVFDFIAKISIGEKKIHTHVV
jgi:hypothetical protein